MSAFIRVFAARPRPADMDYRIRNSACKAACCIVAAIVALTVAAGALSLGAPGNAYTAAIRLRGPEARTILKVIPLAHVFCFFFPDNDALEVRGLRPTLMSVFEADRILGFNDSAPFRK